MTNAGNPNPKRESFSDDYIDNVVHKRGCTIPVLLGLAVAIVSLSVIGIHAIGLFVAIVAPPLPPVPIDATLISTSTDEFGWTNWLYESDIGQACAILELYQADGQCQPSIPCTDVPSWHIGQRIMTCQTDVTSANFTMRWQAILRIAPQSAEIIEIELSRFIAWLGDTLPEPTPIDRIPPR